MTDRRQFLLGLLILVSLGTLGIYTLFGSNMNLFGDKVYLEATFPVAKELRKGDSVMLAGTRVGRVTSVRFRSDAPDNERILVNMRIDEQIVLRDGYEIQIRDATLLGGRMVAIEPGPFGSPALTIGQGEVLTGTVPADIFAAMEDLASIIGEEGDGIRNIIRDAEKIVGDLEEGGLAENLTKASEDFRTAGEGAASLVAGVESGEGNLGALFKDDALYNTWLDAGRSAEETLRLAREGEGLVGALLSDTEMAQSGRQAVTDLQAAAADVRAFTDGMADVDSLANRIVRDEKLGQQFAKIADDVADFTGRLRNPDSTLGRLIDSNEIYDRALVIVDDVAAITTKVRAGEGTVGRLIMSDEIYDEFNFALKTLNRSLEDYREAAPVTTFTSLIFGGF
ncbi:MlaD family protein [Engelhardtia mirabilis]|uniref:Mce related protein n=1 Tax=Engelhardtia mirabilis TaxID=2528011 RepID=A0A518BPG4_9BACT|nr:mce related protein [Planctomycetes bacterium Pla133]QDV03196.1 mce related protein [Planctomycetes bacterium Pla86]